MQKVWEMSEKIRYKHEKNSILYIYILSNYIIKIYAYFLVLGTGWNQPPSRDGTSRLNQAADGPTRLE